MRYTPIILFFLLYSCSNTKKEDKPVPSPAELKESLVNVNKIYAKKESDDIDQYISRRNWSMVSTGTGLRCMIYKNGWGEQAKADQFARVNYKISLLDGTVCYSSEKSGPKEFLIDQDHVESGLHEGVKYMKVGDKAILIIPSHLAHGLIGDEDKIPAKATLVFDLELLSLR